MSVLCSYPQENEMLPHELYPQLLESWKVLVALLSRYKWRIMMRIWCYEFQRYEEFRAMKLQKKGIYEMPREELPRDEVYEKQKMFMRYEMRSRLWW